MDSRYKLNRIEIKLFDIQGRLFKLATKRGINSTEFIKVFMKSATAKALDSTYNRMQWAGEEYLLEEVMDEAGGRFEKPGEIYDEELIYDGLYLSVLALCDRRI